MSIRPQTHRPSGLARRAALLDAAIEVVAERGISAATHRAIAARAGVSASTTSYFFESIDALLAEAMRERLAEQVDRLRALAETIENRDTATEPRGARARTVDDLADAAAVLVLGVPRALTVAQFETYLMASRDNTYSDYAAEMFDAFENLVATGLRAEGAAGPEEGARAVVALTDGLMLQHLARGTSRAHAKEEIRAALAVAINAYLED